MLLGAPVEIRETALNSYNLACYEAQLGNVEPAKVLVCASITKDPEMQKTALDDIDLEPLWD